VVILPIIVLALIEAELAPIGHRALAIAKAQLRPRPSPIWSSLKNSNVL